MKLTFDNVQSFDDLKGFFVEGIKDYEALERKHEGLQGHTKEVEADNYDLQRENMQLKDKVERLTEIVEDFTKEVGDYYRHCDESDKSVDAYELGVIIKSFSKAHFREKTATAENSDE